MRREQGIVLGTSGKGKSFDVLRKDIEEHPEKYNKYVYDYVGETQKELERTRNDLLKGK